MARRGRKRSILTEGTLMKIDSKEFRVREGEAVDLKKWPTKIDPVYKSKEHYKSLLEEYVAKLNTIQEAQFASNRHAVLVILQGMDASGKDGVVRHMMSGVNPQGCRVYSFKQPSEAELEHDFLWRTSQHLPERGRIAIFNRSYYEEVLVVRVHREILEHEGIPDADRRHKLWRDRYRSINDFEKHMDVNGTRIVKLFLHLSKKEQLERFLERIDDPKKNWKFSDSDLKEREFWDDYRKAYEECLGATSTRDAPWYVVPADDKANARLIVSQIVLDTFEKLDLSYPKTSPKRTRELQAIRKQLTK
jgi:PPK2 family polyphosphate:nucleotide phosphotransferase